MSEKWSKEFDSCFQVGSIEEIADALEKRSGSEENALAMLAMTAFTLMTRLPCWSRSPQSESLTIQTKHRIVTQTTINIIKNVRCGIIAPPLPSGGYRATIMLLRHYSRALG